VALSQQANIHFFYWKGNENHELGTVFSYIRESYQQLTKVEIIND
jgi:hypothetical protein